MKLLFEVEEFVPYKNGFGLSGRCTSGTIKIGDIFVLASRLSRHYDEDRNITLHREALGRINLKVIEIQYFDKSISELQRGHSGGLYAIGDGFELLYPGCEIENQ